jgi:hypothetical protein
MSKELMREPDKETNNHGEGRRLGAEMSPLDMPKADRITLVQQATKPVASYHQDTGAMFIQLM